MFWGCVPYEGIRTFTKLMPLTVSNPKSAYTLIFWIQINDIHHFPIKDFLPTQMLARFDLISTFMFAFLNDFAKYVYSNIYIAEVFMVKKKAMLPWKLWYKNLYIQQSLNKRLPTFFANLEQICINFLLIFLKFGTKKPFMIHLLWVFCVLIKNLS